MMKMRVFQHPLTLVFCLAIIGLSVLFFLLTPAESPDYRATRLNLGEDATRHINSPSNPHFTDRTMEAGLTASHLQGGETLAGIDETLGAGACALDFDNDGWIDLFVVGGSGQSRYFGKPEWWQRPHHSILYKNLGNGRFEDVTQQSNIRHNGWGMGCAIGDLDNDGDQDLFIANRGKNTLYRNNGDGTFTDVTDRAGVSDDRWSTSVAMADYDGDGRLDIYVVNYLRFSKGQRLYEAATGFEPSTDPRFDAALHDAAANRLYRNTGDMVFEDVTGDAGVADSHGRGLAAVWLDIDLDRRPDLLIGNGGGSPVSLYMNRGQGKFAEAASYFRLNTAEGVNGIAVGDIDNDGDNDLALSTTNPFPILVYLKGESPTQTQSGQGTKIKGFKDLSRDLGVGDERHIGSTGWSLGLKDFNNDGWLDLFVANGLVTTDPDAPKLSQGQRNKIWLNRGNGSFRTQDLAGSDTQSDALSTRGAVFADFDNDGDVDIYLTNNNNLGQLLINDAPKAHWLGVRLVGLKSNRDAIGAKIWLQTASGTQFRTLVGSQGFLSDGDKRLHFGLAKDTKIDKVTVEWPDGSQMSYQNLPVDRYMQINQDNAKFVALPPSTEAQSPVLRLQIGAESARHRSSYVQWLVTYERSDNKLPEMSAAISDPDPSVRAAAIRMLGEIRSPIGLRLLLKGLDDDDVTNRVVAVKALREYESEDAVRWLLRLFSDSDVGVRCEIAKNFEFYFREEEAVPVQKYLAVPYLVRMLGDREASGRQCAARALASAERFRAVLPLTNLLHDPAVEVRIEAARSLGLIRERVAVPYLRTLLDNGLETPVVKAQALIALKRLGDPDFDQALQTFLPVQPTGTADVRAQNALNTLLLIVRNRDDGVVISLHRIGKLVAIWSRMQLSYRTGLLSDDPAVAILALDILKETRDSSGISTAQALVSHENAEVRTKAYETLIMLDASRAQSHAVKGLMDPSTDVQRHVLNSLLGGRVKPRIEDFLPLLNKIETRVPTLRLLAKYRSEKAKKVLHGILSSSKVDVQDQLAALQSLIEQGKNQTPLSAGIYTHDDAAIRAAALFYWVTRHRRSPRISQIPPVLSKGLTDPSDDVRLATIKALSTRNEPWAIQALSKQMFDRRAPLAVRKYALDVLVQKKTHQTGRFVLKMARLRHDAFRIEALRALRGVTGQDVIKFLWHTLDNPKESPLARLAAAEILLPDHQATVLAKLRGGIK